MPRITKGEMYNRKMRRGRARALVRSKPMRFRRGRIKQPVQYFKRTLFIPNYFQIGAGAGDTFAQKNFMLSEVPGAGDFTSLYDQYKIKGVSYKLLPRYNTAQTGSIQHTRVFSVLDYDDDVASTSIGQLTQYQNLKMTSSIVTHSRYLVPKSLAAVGDSGITPVSGSPGSRWVDVALSSLEHYGIKIGVQSPGTAVTFDAMITYYLAFRNVR